MVSLLLLLERAVLPGDCCLAFLMLFINESKVPVPTTRFSKNCIPFDAQPSSKREFVA